MATRFRALNSCSIMASVPSTRNPARSVRLKPSPCGAASSTPPMSTERMLNLPASSASGSREIRIRSARLVGATPSTASIRTSSASSARCPRRVRRMPALVSSARLSGPTAWARAACARSRIKPSATPVSSAATSPPASTASSRNTPAIQRMAVPLQCLGWCPRTRMESSPFADGYSCNPIMSRLLNRTLSIG